MEAGRARQQTSTRNSYCKSQTQASWEEDRRWRQLGISSHPSLLNQQPLIFSCCDVYLPFPDT
ncbi:hypothetical protein CCACVL1_11724 [Corchorus capsularis]|uniref:Uncharacterized protein n=1 Tax=Corchorus capsularis TaxID=210143 RepID=A0A1R3IJW9_COCAP|nr:hypothetical protein CCACVL1_11724 [Corchorus capsularis]